MGSKSAKKQLKQAQEQIDIQRAQLDKQNADEAKRNDDLMRRIRAGSRGRSSFLGNVNGALGVSGASDLGQAFLGNYSRKR